MPKLPNSPCIDIHNFRLNMFVNRQSPNRVEDTVICVQIPYYIQACEARNSRGSPLTGFSSASPPLLSLGRYSNTVTHIIQASCQHKTATNPGPIFELKATHNQTNGFPTLFSTDIHQLATCFLTFLS